MAPAALLAGTTKTCCTLLSTPTHSISLCLQENDYHLVPRTSQPAFSLSPLLHRRLFYCRSLSFFFPASRSLSRSLLCVSSFNKPRHLAADLVNSPVSAPSATVSPSPFLDPERKHSVVSLDRELTRYKFIGNCGVLLRSALSIFDLHCQTRRKQGHFKRRAISKGFVVLRRACRKRLSFLYRRWY